MSYRWISMRAAVVAVAVLLAAGTAPRTATAAGYGPRSVVFTSIASRLPGNIPSEGPQAYGFSELGDGIMFPAPTGGTLATVEVVMSSWACQSGDWYNPVGTANSCVSAPQAMFDQPITMNIYQASNSGSQASTLLATLTKTFTIPYRPSSNGIECGPTGNPGGDGQEWYSPTDHMCYHGMSYPIVFDFSSLSVPLSKEIVIGISFNTSDFGPHPLGQNTACYKTVEGCPYDSLNIGVFGDVYYPAADSIVSSVFDPNGVFVNYTIPANSCSGIQPTGILEDDQPCFTGYHPELAITATCGTKNLPGCSSSIGPVEGHWPVTPPR
jgi:hypothetical protein